MHETKLEISQSDPKEEEKSGFCVSVLKTIFHIVCISDKTLVIIFGFIVWHSMSEEDLKNPKVWEAHYFMPLFLTNWNVSFQTLFLFLSLVYDLLEWADKTQSDIAKKISFLRDVVFSGLVVPFTLFVTGMFWIIYWIDRELVFPTIFDEVVPWWFNHCVHTNILIVVAIETVLQPRRHPRHLMVETLLYCVVTFGYAVVYYSIYFFAHRWLYDVFGIMTWWQVCLFQILIWISTHIFYKIQFPINRLFHKRSNSENMTQSVEFLHEKAINDFGEIVREDNTGKINGNSTKLTSFENLHLEGKLDGSFDDRQNKKEKHLTFEEVDLKHREKQVTDEFKTENNGTLKRDAKIGTEDKVASNVDKLETYVNEMENNKKFVYNGKNNNPLNPNDDFNDDSLENTFEKSWSLKYRSVRNEPDNSSL